MSTDVFLFSNTAPSDVDLRESAADVAPQIVVPPRGVLDEELMTFVLWVRGF